MNPTLETQRLILRRPDGRDAESFIRFYGDSRSQHTGGPIDADAAWLLLACEIGHWELKGFGTWAVCAKSDLNTSLGMVGCWQPGAAPERELGWLIWPGAEGKGIAAEAAIAARHDAFTRLGFKSIVSYITHANTRSIALAKRIGAVLDPAADTPRSKTSYLYRHPAPEVTHA
jgi:RimJ/RimL family protein N-acetyltransferase